MSILLVVFFLGLALQIVVNIFVTDRSSEYTLKTEDNEYNITEQLEVVDDASYYNIGITDKNGEFYSVVLEKNLNKQTKIVRDIKYFKAKNLRCIFPVFMRDITGNVSCLYNGENVTYDYLMQIENTDVVDFIKQLKKENYNHNSWSRKESQKFDLYEEGKGIEVYQDNILDDYIFLIWRYKGLYILNSEESIIKDYLDNDVYDNSLSQVVGNYYVTANRKASTSRINKLYCYDFKSLKKEIIVLPEETSANVYFNGVYDGKLYMTDVGKEQQFMIDPAKKKIEEVGDGENGFISIIDEEKVVVSAREFLVEPVYFNGFVSNDKINEKYGNDVEVLRDGKFSYFKTTEGKVYRTYVNAVDQAELLFQLDDITEWKVRGGDVLVTAGEMAYFYNLEEGLVPIAYNKELIYNYNNIYDFWRK